MAGGLPPVFALQATPRLAGYAVTGALPTLRVLLGTVPVFLLESDRIIIEFMPGVLPQYLNEMVFHVYHGCASCVYRSGGF